MTSKIHKTPNILARRLGEELVLINLETDKIFTLNLTGARTWELIENTGDPEQVRAELLEEFQVAPDALDLELERLLLTLVDEGFIVIDLEP